ncbi:hypothetical protein P153DRAFT_368489, partial [Dothidotthia symphoricarpi CBS 119687]
MSLFRTLDRSSCTSALSTNAHARPFLAFLWPARHTRTATRSFSKSAVHSPPQLTMDTLFIQALARAGSCPEHAKQISMLRHVPSNSSTPHKARRNITCQQQARRGLRTETNHKWPLKRVKRFAEKELKALVDYYGIEIDTRPEEEVEDDGSLVWNVGDDHEPWPLRDKADDVHIKRLEELLKDDEASHDLVFDTYKKLPSPGVVYLELPTIRALLHHLSVVERVSSTSMQRLLSILDDMKTAHIHIIRTEWTSAIYMAGRFVGKVSADEVQSALYIWRDMEQRAKVKGGYVTLNVLFDVAVKAGKYTLAETFLKEMKMRKLRLHRHFRVSLIYYYGVLQDGNAVRKAYQDLVSAGDIVDTVVMNAVIAALIRAGEPSAAEHVFERMKRLHASKKPPSPGHKFFTRDWRDRRLLGLHLTHEVRRLEKTDLEQRKKLQDYAPIAPDSRTYAILIRHQAATVGDIDRVH